MTTQAFWSLRSSVERALVEPFRGTEEEAEEELDRLLRDAVEVRMHADVPLGAFLSGGIDSSLIVALMQAQSDLPVRTFSIGFHEEAYDEARDARAVARHLGTDHTELYVTSGEAIDLVSRLPDVYDEPFADSSQIPTLLVSQLTRRHVTVSLSGDAGDEVFGGYNRYTWGGRLWNGLEHSPHYLRRLAAAGMTAVGPQLWDAAFKRMRPLLPKSWRQRMPGYKVHKLASLLASEGPMEMYASMASHWFEPERVVAGAAALRPLHMIEDQWLKLPEFERQAMYLDTITYLPNDILVKLDRATMAFGLEGRVPFLDPRVVEFAWRLPLQMKVRPNQGKWILRQVLLPLRAGESGREAQDGVRHPAGFLAARSHAGMGRGAAGTATFTGGRILRPGSGSRKVERLSSRTWSLAVPSLGHSYVSALVGTSELDREAHSLASNRCR